VYRVNVVSAKAAAARAEFQKLRDQDLLTPAVAARLAAQAAQACLASTAELDAAVPLLAEIATLADADLASFGTEAIFRQVVEPLADAFDPECCDLYIRFMARLLECCRRLSSPGWLEAQLARFGISNEGDLIRRALSLRRLGRAVVEAGTVEKVLVLSRVTLGADVAVTSVVLRKMMQMFPNADLVFIGGDRSALLFAGEPRVRARRAPYSRSGGLLDRLAAWPAVAAIVEDEVRDLRAGRYVIIDPDSRLTQLGMLPLAAGDTGYLFFESRSYSKPGCEALSDLTSAWLDDVFGPGTGPARPWVSLPAEALRLAESLCAVLRSPVPCQSGPALFPVKGWISVNFGVGDNPGKRVADDFEYLLLTELLARGWRVFLDRGDGAEESARTGNLLARLRESGTQIAEIEERDPLPPSAGVPVVAWRGSLAGFGALIGLSDLYIGYDSACQHIAAALGKRTVDIVAGFRSPRILQRWRPCGSAEVKTVVVSPEAPARPERILGAVLEAVSWM